MLIENMDKCNLSTPEFSLKGIETYCRLVDMYDADTLTLIVPLFDHYYKFACRVYGIDTAEIKSKLHEHKELAHKAKNKMLHYCGVTSIDLNRMYTRKEIQTILSEKVYLLWCKFDKFDKYGRPIVYVYDKENGTDLATLLLQENLANAYFGGTKTTTFP